jgi:hypothetical protein
MSKLPNYIIEWGGKRKFIHRLTPGLEEDVYRRDWLGNIINESDEGHLLYLEAEAKLYIPR